MEEATDVVCVEEATEVMCEEEATDMVSREEAMELICPKSRRNWHKKQLPDAWHNRISPKTGWPCVSIL